MGAHTQQQGSAGSEAGKRECCGGNVHITERILNKDTIEHAQNLVTDNRHRPDGCIPRQSYACRSEPGDPQVGRRRRAERGGTDARVTRRAARGRGDNVIFLSQTRRQAADGYVGVGGAAANLRVLETVPPLPLGS